MPPTPILSHMNLAHVLSLCLFTINFSVFVPSAPGSSQAVVSVGFSPHDCWCVSPSPHTRHLPRVCYPSSFGHSDDVWCWVQIMKLLVMHFSLSSFYFTSFAQICSSVTSSLTSSFGILPLMSEVKLISHP